MPLSSIKHLSNIHINDEYGTPLTLLYQACQTYDVHPKLDVAASRINHVCDRYFTKQDDALTKEWDEDFFLNPPYSQVEIFIKYAYQQYKKHNVTGLILTYSKTDTKWWHDYIEGRAETYFIKGRIRFFDENGKLTRNSAPYPSCFIIYRKHE